MLDRISAHIFGAFSLRSPEGMNLTPSGTKNRALCAMLVLSTNQRRGRQWLRERLWEDPSSKFAQTSLRTSLRVLRKALGELAFHLHSDRNSVWFEPKVLLQPKIAGATELLEDLDVPISVFEDWIRDVRQTFDTGTAPGQQSRVNRSERLKVVIKSTDSSSHESGKILATLMRDLTAEKLKIQGDIDIDVVGPDWQEEKSTEILIEIESFTDNDQWYVMARINGPPRLSFLWSGRLQLSLDLSESWNSPKLRKFVNKITTAILDRGASRLGVTPYFQLQNAVRRLFTGDLFDLKTAEKILRNLQDKHSSGAVSSWLSYLHLTEAFEFRADIAEKSETALALVDEALKASPYSPLVSALSSQVVLKLSGDIDFGRHLAAHALNLAEGDAYSLDAMSQIKSFSGEHDTAFDLAKQAQDASRGLANEFSWDMLCCMAALGIGDYHSAWEYAISSHRKEPSYRPALRYVVALSLLLGRNSEAADFTAKLQRLEPDFNPALILTPDYPMETFRMLGLADELRPSIEEIQSKT